MADATVRFSDGHTSAVHFVALSWEDQALVILSAEGQVLERWDYQDIRERSLSGGTDYLQITGGHGVGARLRLESSNDIANCRFNCPNLSQLPGREAGWWKTYAFWTVGAVASLGVLFFVIIPSLSSQIAKLIPYTWEQELGEGLEHSVLIFMEHSEDKGPGPIICESEDGLLALNEMTAPLVNAHDNDLAIKVKVIDVDLVNAITLPGGHIIVFRGLLDKAEHPNELAAVIGHEIGHVAYRHGMQNLVSTSAVTGLISLLLGDVTGGIVMAGALEMAINSANSRDAEREADDYGLALLDELALDSQPMADMFAKLGKEIGDSGAMAWASSHPGMSERIAHIKESVPHSGRSLDDKNWQALKNICQ